MFLPLNSLSQSKGSLLENTLETNSSHTKVSNSGSSIVWKASRKLPATNNDTASTSSPESATPRNTPPNTLLPYLVSFVSTR